MNVLLIGTGKMGKEYCKVLQGQNINFSVIGNSESGCEKFEKETGVKAIPGGATSIKNLDKVYTHAINAVAIESLHEVTKNLVELGIENILLEKPGALLPNEIDFLKNVSSKNISLAYNRRFYSSVRKLTQIAEEDGGIESFHFEFTEWIDGILEDFSHPEVLRNWFMCNSSHVVDLAFYLGGVPTHMNCEVSHPLDWHPSGANFAGNGKTSNGSLFTYRANWNSAGRWGLEFHTPNRKLILCPMESLSQVKRNSVSIEAIELDDDFDERFKPGLYLMTKAFLDGESGLLLSLEDFLDIRERIFLKIPNYST